MRAISSHRDIKMRVLILSAALFACATGAPSGLLAPVPALIPAVAVPGVNYGDLKGAIIDAKVQAEDQLRSIAEQQREANEQAQVNNEQVVDAVDQAKERSLEAFWANEDKKWQALDALKTAEAQIDGQIASADGYGKSLVYGSPVVSTFGVIPTPVIHPGIVAPVIKTFSTEQLLQINAQAAKTEEKKTEEQKTEEQTKPAEIKPEDNKESVSVESANNAEASASAPTTTNEGSTIFKSQQYLSPVAFSPLKFASPYVTSPLTFYQPGYNTFSALPYQAHLLTPTVYKTW